MVVYNLTLDSVIFCPGLPGTLPVYSCYTGSVINSSYNPLALKGNIVWTMSSYVKHFTIEFS